MMDDFWDSHVAGHDRRMERTTGKAYSVHIEENGFRILKSRNIHGSIPIVYLAARKI